uniref:Zgc:194242 n=1 Tax=Erpetoichthys calabaricus TaxID=27687 RepID=A0A8C4T5U9_ERPCA
MFVTDSTIRSPHVIIDSWLIKKYLERKNKILEENAVNLAQIQPNSVVLELGFGPGLGLQEAVHHLTDSKGKLYGIDYSEYMHKVATRRVQEQITSGKAQLLLGSVEKIPLPDSSVDRVFHCNCYYYWPDLKKCSAELHRVMKPGNLSVTQVVSQGLLRGKIWHPEHYMDALLATGFKDIRMEEMEDRDVKFNAIFATASKLS